MKTPYLSHALWVLVALIAFLAGRLGSDPLLKSSAPDRSGSASTHALPDTNLSALNPTALEQGERDAKPTTLTREQARVETFALLSTPRRLERLSRLCDMLEHMTKENWHDINQAFVMQTKSTGRTHHMEWLLMLDRVGEVAGEEAIGEMLAKDRSGERFSAIAAGWAAGNPQAAMKWFEAQSSENQAAMADDFMEGLARNDPARALYYVGAHLSDKHDNLIPVVVDGLIQQSGIQRSEEMLPALGARADIPDGVKGAFYWSLAQRQIQIARLNKDPKAILAWADRTAGVRLAGPAALDDMVSYAAQNDATGTFEWVIERSSQWHPEQIDRVFPSIAAIFQEQAPDKFAEWMNENPNHPQRDMMAAAVAQGILNSGDYDTALQWAHTLAPGGVRTKLESSIIQSRDQK